MQTEVSTPHAVFWMPQRLMVPLFQRRYVWNQDAQWEPLWDDIVRVAERRLTRPQENPEPHSLGAVVVQQLPHSMGKLPVRTIIDGQQRLTTLQLLLDALHAELLGVGASLAAARIEPLVANPDQFCSAPEDRFKVWPTNKDRDAFNAVMGATPPVDYAALGRPGERMVEAHRYFSEQARSWLAAAGPQAVPTRADAIEVAVREHLQMVIINLGPDENAQEIFETLNARGTPLSAADLIKNFVFQRIAEAGDDVEAIYARDWVEFETGFWETPVGAGRSRHVRSALFLTQWLVAQTGADILARDVFSRFKRYALDQRGKPISRLLTEIRAASVVYRDFVNAAATHAGPLDRIALFAYRTSTLESEVIKPLVLHLLDPNAPPIPRDQIEKGLSAVESWMVRRMLARETTKNYNQVVSELLTHLRGAQDRSRAGDLIETWLASQTGSSRYWPDDEHLRSELLELPAYRRIGRSRLRMVLEAVEDHLRGWGGGRPGYAADMVRRSGHAIEHVMPRKWASHWRNTPGFVDDAERDHLVHTLGNLTLLTKRLNSTVSNSRWKTKRAYLHKHEPLLLTRDLLEAAGEAWTGDSIRARTRQLVEIILKVWPVPPGHRSGFASPKPARLLRKVTLADLLAAGLLEPGMSLIPRSKGLQGRVATLLSDGDIDVNGERYTTPADAAAAIAGRKRNGMWFFLVTQEPKRSLATVKRQYLEQIAGDGEVDDEDGDGD